MVDWLIQLPQQVLFAAPFLVGFALGLLLPWRRVLIVALVLYFVTPLAWFAYVTSNTPPDVLGWVLLAALGRFPLFGGLCALGIGLGQLLRASARSPKGGLLGGAGVVGAVALVVWVSVSREAAHARWMAASVDPGAAFLRQQSEVIAAVGHVNRWVVSGHGEGKTGRQTGILYYVEGSNGRAHVMVRVSGSREAPVYSIDRIDR